MSKYILGQYKTVKYVEEEVSPNVFVAKLVVVKDEHPAGDGGEQEEEDV